LKTPEQIANILEQTFSKIQHENMQDVPILNRKLKVQTLGFQEYQGRVIGIVITPWLMNVVMLPKEGDDWELLALGHKQFYEFPSKNYRFMVNDIDGIGFCQTHSLFSPMYDFSCQQQAVNAAQDFINKLLVESKSTAEDQVDEELLGKIMRGEETPEIDLDDFAAIEPYENQIPVKNITPSKIPEKKKFDRRALLRGSFMGSE